MKRNKNSISHQAKRRKEEKNRSPRNRKACHSVSTALLQSILFLFLGHAGFLFFPPFSFLLAGGFHFFSCKKVKK
jgi:hypothetical protein